MNLVSVPFTFRLIKDDPEKYDDQGRKNFLLFVCSFVLFVREKNTVLDIHMHAEENFCLVSSLVLTFFRLLRK